MKAVQLCLVAVAALASASVMAQTCKTGSIEASVNPDRLIDNGDGTVTDAKTGLMWSQCSLGQTWSDTGCKEEAASLSWQQALQAANQFNHNGGLAGHSDWRIPNVKELGSLVEHQCHSPAINLAFFPDTPSATYLAATVNVDPLTGNVLGGRSINFETGSDLTPETSTRRHVRLVRSN